MAPNKEGFQWLMTILNSVYSVVDTLGKFGEKVPEEWKQRLPGFLGLSLEDERLFNGVLAQLDVEKQVLIGKFLYEKCKDYERNRFINIVAGMEVVPGKPEEKETKKDSKTGNVVFEKTKSGTKGIDCRKKFLESFAYAIEKQFGGDLQKAYEFCVGGRMIIPDPMHQKVLRAFSESTAWFKKVILMPFGVNSVAELVEKVKNNLSNNAADITKRTQTFRERARAFREKNERR